MHANQTRRNFRARRGAAKTGLAPERAGKPCGPAENQDERAGATREWMRQISTIDSVAFFANVSRG